MGIAHGDGILGIQAKLYRVSGPFGNMLGSLCRKSWSEWSERTYGNLLEDLFRLVPIVVRLDFVKTHETEVY